MRNSLSGLAFSQSFMTYFKEKERLAQLLEEAYQQDGYSSLTPSSIMLNAAYPNPFNSTTRITFQLPVDMSVQITIVDLTGRIVENLLNGDYIAGTHNLTWNADHVASGNYYLKIKAGDQVATKLISLIR